MVSFDSLGYQETSFLLFTLESSGTAAIQRKILKLYMMAKFLHGHRHKYGLLGPGQCHELAITILIAREDVTELVATSCTYGRDCPVRDYAA